MNLRSLSEIWIYPVKSLGGIRMNKATVQKKGLEYDRRWMLIDENNRFITQRRHPGMALFNLRKESTHFLITWHGDTITLPFNTTSADNEIPATVWNDTVKTIEVSSEHNAWFSQRLQLSCKLVYFPDHCTRPVDPDYAKDNEQVSLADSFPFLIIGQASLDDLNTRLEKEVSIHRFRPNFVFTGGAPYEEDHWEKFSIGKVHFQGVKKCSRCELTTINHQTGEKGVEPLRTLSRYRKQNNKVLFGQNLIAFNGGELSTGDLIRLN